MRERKGIIKKRRRKNKMKKFFSVLIGLIVVAMIIIAGRTFFESQKELSVKRTAKDGTALQVAEKTIEDKDSYYAEVERLNTQTSIDEPVNAYIDSVLMDFIDEQPTDKKVAKYKRAALTNTIDSYKVNDNIYGIRVTTNLKKVDSEDYNTIIKTFNYDKETGEEVTLGNLFKKGYEDVVGSYDQLLLKSQSMLLYNGQENKEVQYNSLKDFTIRNVLLADNLKMSQEEYDEMFKGKIDPDQKMIAITFDDGPHPTNTQKILDALEKYGGRATFFMLGQNAQEYPDAVKAVYESGSEIGIHTWNHPQLTKLSSDKILKQVQDTSDVIYELTGYRPKIVRPPYGAINDTVKTTLKDYPLICWNIDSEDWKSKDENVFVPRVMKDVSDGDIVLLHDIHNTTVPGAEKIIKQLTEQGYQLVTVSELLEVKECDTVNIRVFYSGD